ncbi:hypothetical protein F4678DRAFT_482921 [Xylaria arbuscula]|nr:hypothetical protein F4678DRAFT_482921 [Xylaria arbuscula]
MATITDPDVGVKIHAVGDVKNGFKFQANRSYNLIMTSTLPTDFMPLQWINGKYLDEEAMFNNGTYYADPDAKTAFEISARKAEPPAKSLNAVDDLVTPRRRLKQRNCQTWIVEAAAHLVHDGMMTQEVADYLNAVKQ